MAWGQLEASHRTVHNTDILKAEVLTKQLHHLVVNTPTHTHTGFKSSVRVCFYRGSLYCPNALLFRFYLTSVDCDIRLELAGKFDLKY